MPTRSSSSSPIRTLRHAARSSSHCPSVNARGRTAQNFFSVALCPAHGYNGRAAVERVKPSQAYHAVRSLVFSVILQLSPGGAAVWRAVCHRHSATGRRHCSASGVACAALTATLSNDATPCSHALLVSVLASCSQRRHWQTRALTAALHSHSNNLRSASRPAGCWPAQAGRNWRARQLQWTLSMALMTSV